MPFLFVDYDQGGGGEYFCNCLSQAPQSEPLISSKFDSGRTKIRDVFGQEFLKPRPNTNINIPLTSEKYIIVPSHRHTDIARQLLKNIKSIRIQYPVEQEYFNFLKQQQINKVLLAVEPTDTYFIGTLKMLSESFGNTDFLHKVNKSMDNLSLLLSAQNIEPTDENRQKYLKELTVFRVVPEPDFTYDLTISYERLFNDPESIAQDLQKCFGIDVDPELLKKYQNDFKQYQAQT
jgi:hypothetical protein